jgi:hypothetical protein
MSYQEKRTLANMVVGFALLIAYCGYMLSAYRNGWFLPDDIKFCAKTMLIFIGIGIAAAIVSQIILHILLSIQAAIRKGDCDSKDIEKEIKCASVEDEMDKLIELKAMKLGFIIAGTGMVSALLAIVLGMPNAVMLNILYLSMSIGSLAEGALSLYYYRRGVSHA